MTQPRAVKRFTTGTDSSPGRKLEDGVSGPHFVEELHEAVVDHEGDGHVQAHARHPRDGSLVESSRTLVHQDLSGAVEGVLVPGCLQALHSVDKKALNSR